MCLPTKLCARDLRRRRRAQPLQVERRLRRLVEHRDLVAAGLQRPDRLAQVLEAELPGRRDVAAERAAERDVLRADDVLRGRRLRRAEELRAAALELEPPRSRTTRRTWSEREDRVRLLDVPPRVRRARQEASRGASPTSASPKKRSSWSETPGPRRSKSGPSTPTLSSKCSVYEPGAIAAPPPLSRADRRAVVEGDGDRVVLVEDDPELERRNRHGAGRLRAEAEDERRAEQCDQRLC